VIKLGVQQLYVETPVDIAFGSHGVKVKVIISTNRKMVS
jgi:hypothetical protein